MADVKGMQAIRSSLPTILATLRRTPQAVPVHFGSRHRNEAVLVSRERYEQQEAALRQSEELGRIGAVAMVRDRLADDRFSEAPSMSSSPRWTTQREPATSVARRGRRRPAPDPQPVRRRGARPSPPGDRLGPQVTGLDPAAAVVDPPSSRRAHTGRRRA